MGMPAATLYLYARPTNRGRPRGERERTSDQNVHSTKQVRGQGSRLPLPLETRVPSAHRRLQDGGTIERTGDAPRVHTSNTLTSALSYLLDSHKSRKASATCCRSIVKESFAFAPSPTLTNV